MRTKLTLLTLAMIIPVALCAGVVRAGSTATVHPTGEWVTLQFVNDSPSQYACINGAGPYAIGTANFVVPHTAASALGPGVVTPGSYSGAPGGDAERLLDGAASNGFKLTAYSIDVGQSISNNSSHVFDIIPLSEAPIGGSNKPGGMGETKAMDLGKLFYADYGLASSGNANDAAAFAACVWEIVNETAEDAQGNYVYGLGTGNFRITSYPANSATAAGSWTSIADGWLAALDTVQYYQTGLMALASRTTQDFAAIIPGTGVAAVTSANTVDPAAPVPEPLTMLTAFLAFGGVGAYVRKHARTEEHQPRTRKPWRWVPDEQAEN